MRILLAYDGSEGAKRALEQASELVEGDGRSMTVVSVAETVNLGRGGSNIVPVDEDSERRRELAEAVELLSGRGVKVRAVERKGEPAAMIIDEAEKEHSELIVIGTRGLNAAKRMVLGSVSTDVVQHAPCSVFVVR
jgi:nucleotide-binding universal stress UspA family protein